MDVEISSLLSGRDVALGLGGGAVYAGFTFLADGSLDLAGAAVFTGAFIVTLAAWNYLQDR